MKKVNCQTVGRMASQWIVLIMNPMGQSLPNLLVDEKGNFNYFIDTLMLLVKCAPKVSMSPASSKYKQDCKVQMKRLFTFICLKVLNRF